MPPYSTASADKYPSPNFHRPALTALDVRGTDSKGIISEMSVRAEGAEVARSFGRIFGDQINVLDYIRPGETANIGFDRAIAILRVRANGGCIIVPNRGGDYKFAAPVILYSNIQIIGIGMPRISYDSENIRAAFITDQFDNLAGGRDRGPVAYARIEGISIYGEWTDLGLGSLPDLPERFLFDPLICKRDAIAMFGQGCQLKNIYIFSVRGNGIHYSYAVQGAATPFDGHLQNILINRTGEHGLVHDFGDSHFTDINITTPSRAKRGGFCGMYCLAGFHGANINVFIGGSTPSRPMYSVWLKSGGGTDVTMGTMESGVYGGVRIDTIRTKINTKAHSPVGYAPYVIRARLTEITGHVYKGTQAGDDVPIAPFVIGGPDPLNPDAPISRPTGCIISLVVDGFDAPIDLSYSNGFNKIILRGSWGYIPEPPAPQVWQGKEVIAGYTGTCDTPDIDLSNVGGEGPFSMRADANADVAATGSTSGGAALIRSTNVRVTSDANNRGVKLRNRLPGVNNNVFNDSAFTVLVYPHSGGRFIGKLADEPVALPPYKGACFYCIAPEWATTLP